MGYQPRPPASVTGDEDMKGAANQANGQVTATTTPAMVFAARPTRRYAIIRNNDSSTSVYVGAPTVTPLNGYKIDPGNERQIDSTVAMQAVTSAGTATISYIEVYD